MSNDQPNKDEWQARCSEWTWQTVDSMIRESYESPGGESLQRIADAHNASLDELRIASNASLESAKRESAKEIAAEKERCKELEEELNQAVKLLKLEDIDAAIAKLKNK